MENARRSQMAQGFAESLGQGKVEVYSAGSRPASQIDPLVIEVMKEKGIDLSSRHPKGLNDLPPVEMDYLVTMGCEEACPAVLSKRIIQSGHTRSEGKTDGFLPQSQGPHRGKGRSPLERCGLRNGWRSKEVPANEPRELCLWSPCRRSDEIGTRAIRSKSHNRSPLETSSRETWHRFRSHIRRFR